MIKTINTLGIVAIVAINVSSFYDTGPDPEFAAQAIQFNENEVSAEDVCMEKFSQDLPQYCQQVEDLDLVDPDRALNI